MEYALSNDSISIKVSTAGGSFTSIEAGGREYLWQGDPAVWSGQAPICFPICGGLRDNSAMTFAGHHVKLARHGFARKQEWKLLSQGENELVMCLASEDNAALLSDYPYPFKLVARYTLEDAAVRVSYEVTNEGTEDMPFFIGGHPGFRCPLDEGEAYTDYELRFEKDEEGGWIWHDDPAFPLEQSAMDELLARLRVLTRKKGSGRTNVYTLADLTVDTAGRTAQRNGRTLELSAREYALLEYLMRNKGVILSRQQIENNLWSLDYAGGTNVVDVYISYLRKKLELPGEARLLHTVRGMGWVLKEDA
mgnify:CR=1 FL=1